MHSVTRFIEEKLGLKVNAEKSKITKPSGIKYLGFGYWKDNKTMHGKYESTKHHLKDSKIK